jgi:hypothetical protein
VKDRVALFRRWFNDWSITTSIIRCDNNVGGRVLIMASISNSSGVVVATGHSETTRGEKGYPVEVSETKAIGRALAVLGIFGGEFASADEFGQPSVPVQHNPGAADGPVVGGDKEGPPSAGEAGEARQDTRPNKLEQTGRSSPEKIAAAILSSVVEKKDIKSLNKLWKNNEPLILQLSQTSPIVFAGIKEEFNRKKLELLGNSKFEKDEML